MRADVNRRKKGRTISAVRVPADWDRYKETIGIEIGNCCARTTNSTPVSLACKSWAWSWLVRQCILEVMCIPLQFRCISNAYSSSQNECRKHKEIVIYYNNRVPLFRLLLNGIQYDCLQAYNLIFYYILQFVCFIFILLEYTYVHTLCILFTILSETDGINDDWSQQ